MIDYLNPHHVYPDAQNQPDLNLYLPRDVSNLEIKEARIENARIGTIGYVGSGKSRINVYELYFTDTLNQAMNEAIKNFDVTVDELEMGLNYFTNQLRSTQSGWYYFDDRKQICKAHHLSLHSKKFRTRKKWANWLQRRYELWVTQTSYRKRSRLYTNRHESTQRKAGESWTIESINSTAHPTKPQPSASSGCTAPA